MQIVDLRSDTVTLPSPEMREAMYKAEVGDDVYGEDPTVNKLEEKAAAMLGKEAALFVCSGTMGNFLALLAHCQRGDEAIVASESHIVVHEQGGISALGSIHPRMLPTQPDGTMCLKEIELSVNPDDIHYARTRLICLENTWHGVALPLDYMKKVSQIAHSNGLKMHLDGARVFNAALALGVPVSQVASHFDTIQFCFSKGLAAPMGSALCGGAEFIKYARRLRKMVGGGMRQVGFAAAAAIVGLDKMVERLAEDHANAKFLGEGLAHVEGLQVDLKTVQTNMVFFHVTLPGLTDGELVQHLAQKGILADMDGHHGVRLVAHYGITREHIEHVLSTIQSVVKEFGRKPASVS
jgi:threonine aldolase